MAKIGLLSDKRSASIHDTNLTITYIHYTNKLPYQANVLFLNYHNKPKKNHEGEGEGEREFLVKYTCCITAHP